MNYLEVKEKIENRQDVLEKYKKNFKEINKSIESSTTELQQLDIVNKEEMEKLKREEMAKGISINV